MRVGFEVDAIGRVGRSSVSAISDLECVAGRVWRITQQNFELFFRKSTATKFTTLSSAFLAALDPSSNPYHTAVSDRWIYTCLNQTRSVISNALSASKIPLSTLAWSQHELP